MDMCTDLCPCSCFSCLSSFTIDLPTYSSADILYSKLTYAMDHCVEIDGDQEHMSGVHQDERHISREEEESDRWTFG